MPSELNQLAKDVMTNFVESRYSTWYGNLEYQREDVEADLLDIIWIKFEALEDDDTFVEPRKVYHITPLKVFEAMRKISNDDSVEIASDLRELIKESYLEAEYQNLDALTDDCIIQVAAFGKLIYG